MPFSITSAFFWFFCAGAAFLTFFLPRRFVPPFLLAAGYFLYGRLNWKYLVLLILHSLAAYWIALAIARRQDGPARRRLLLLGIVLPLGTLLFFKFQFMVWAAVQGIARAVLHLQPAASLGLVLPLGISFYVFKLIGYLIDVYRRKIPAETRPDLLALYISFFPQIAAGPIDRAGNLLPQFHAPPGFDWERVVSGANLIVWGVFKKMVIADRLAFYVSHVMQGPPGNGIGLLFGAYFYAFQIYCDFSGYSDIAVGLARIMGFSTMNNFDHPYASRSMTQFWSKWHISLSTWLRDYLFLPITYAVMRRIPGEKLAGIKAETWGYAVGMSLTMVLCGIWHGAGWTFVVWGALHGLYLIVGFASKAWRKRWLKKTGLKRRPRLHAALAVFTTFNLVSLAWIFFLAPNLGAAGRYLKYIQFSWPNSGQAHLWFDAILLLVFMALEYVQRRRRPDDHLARLPRPLKLAAFALFVCLILMFWVDSGNEFIYVRF